MKKFIVIFLTGLMVITLVYINSKQSVIIESVGKINKDVEYTEYISNDGLFEVRLYIQEQEIIQGSSIEIFATLEYIGDKKKATISHGRPFFLFKIKGDNGFETMPLVFTEALTSELKKGVVYEIPFVKNGFIEDQFTEKFKKYYYSEDLLLMSGRYTIEAFTEFEIIGQDTDYSIGVVADFIVN